ncbi:MAG: right-handed parallel beta-helix repeat-containing protein [Prevotella sp.]|nr:right-handed parallel beta-helix repeat-containing protein [Prevotella sp.]
MKRLFNCILLLLAVSTLQAGEIVVKPGESLHNALRKAREWRRTNAPQCEGGITIVIKAGRYYMSEPLFIRPEDSGTAATPLLLKGEEGTVICGDPKQPRKQIWPEEGMERIVSFDKEACTITIPRHDSLLLAMPSMEMVVHQRWAIAILRVKDMRAHDDSIVVSFKEPESRLEFEHPWPQPVIGGERGNSSFLLRTAVQRDGIEQLVIVDGANHVGFEGITFENTCWNRPLHKGHVTLQGGFPLVDAYKLKEKEGLPWDEVLENQAWIERPVSAVAVRNAESVSFTGCRFQHLSATALDYESVNNGTIKGCTFEDIGGTAILAGSFAESPLEVHRPYTHLADKCSGLRIIGNTIHDATNEDWGAVAISCGYVKNTTIEGNTVSHVNYSGICIGWGWTPHYTGMENNHIINNKVSDYARQLYDAGGIYTLSNQPNSSISDNEISPPYPAPYATNHRGFCIYLDARTDGYTIENNKSGGRLIRRDEIGDNHPGPNLIFRQ